MKKFYLIIIMFSVLLLSGCNKEKREEYRKAVADGKQMVEDNRDELIAKIKADFGDTVEIGEPEAYIYNSGGIGGFSGEQYYCTRFIDTLINLDNQEIQVRYDTQTGKMYSNYVKLNADKELEDFLTTEMDVSVRKLDIAFLLEGVSHYDILETDKDYSFSELSKAENLLSQNNTPEIEVICIYDGELNVEKIETFVKELYQNNIGYEIQLCFIRSDAEDIKDLLKTSHDDWKSYIAQLEFPQINGTERKDKYSPNFDYQKVKTITSINNIHEENKKKYQVFQFDIYNEP